MPGSTVWPERKRELLPRTARFQPPQDEDGRQKDAQYAFSANRAMPDDNSELFVPGCLALTNQSGIGGHQSEKRHERNSQSEAFFRNAEGAAEGSGEGKAAAALAGQANIEQPLSWRRADRREGRGLKRYPEQDSQESGNEEAGICLVAFGNGESRAEHESAKEIINSPRPASKPWARRVRRDDAGCCGRLSAVSSVACRRTRSMDDAANGAGPGCRSGL